MTHDNISAKESKYTPLTRFGRNLLRKVNKAFKEFSLIEDGDHVLVAVSGGKDSLTLLHLLLLHKRFYQGDFTVSAVHIVSDFNSHAEQNRRYLAGMFESLGIDHGFVEITVTLDREGSTCDPSCFWCSWKRRAALFEYCVDKGYNKLALGHHFDDVAETTLLNLIYHGNLETMLPKRDFFDGKFELIRPLFYVREKDMVRFADMAGFETSTCSCPNDEKGKRKMMKELIRNLSKDARQLNVNLWNAAKTWQDKVGDKQFNKTPRTKD